MSSYRQQLFVYFFFACLLLIKFFIPNKKLINVIKIKIIVIKVNHSLENLRKSCFTHLRQKFFNKVYINPESTNLYIQLTLKFLKLFAYLSKTKISLCLPKTKFSINLVKMVIYSSRKNPVYEKKTLLYRC